MPQDPKTERIAKRIAGAGVCSRRDAEKYIAEGRVTLNGKILDTPAIKVGAEDIITIDGTPLANTVESRIFKYYKPTGILTTTKDPEGRPTVFEQLPKNLPRLISVGRLDINSEGLLLFTTNSALATKLMHPKTEVERVYRVRTFGLMTKTKLEALRAGVSYEGINYLPAKVEWESVRKKGQNHWLKITLKEGKNREIRNMLRTVDIQVNRLIRLSYGPIELANLAENKLEEIPSSQLKKLEDL